MIDPIRLQEGLAKRELFAATLLAEDIDTGVVIQYALPDSMLVANLQGELPPHLLLTGPSARFSATLRADVQTWEELPPSFGFGIYRLLDPRFVLKHSEVIGQPQQLSASLEQASLQLSLWSFASIGVLEEIVKALIEAQNGKEVVDVSLTVRDEQVPTEMTVSDFPPQPSLVTLRFTYPESA